MNEMNIELRVIELVSKESGLPKQQISLNSNLVSDLWIVGDDALQLLNALDNQFEFNWSKGDVHEIFPPEGPLLILGSASNFLRRVLFKKYPGLAVQELCSMITAIKKNSDIR